MLNWSQIITGHDQIHKRYPKIWDLKLIKRLSRSVMTHLRPGMRILDVVVVHSVVAEDVAPYSIMAGNPIKLVRFRFDKSIIEELQKIAWWNCPRSKIEEVWPLLLS